MGRNATVASQLEPHLRISTARVLNQQFPNTGVIQCIQVLTVVRGLVQQHRPVEWQFAIVATQHEVGLRRIGNRGQQVQIVVGPGPDAHLRISRQAGVQQHPVPDTVARLSVQHRRVQCRVTGVFRLIHGVQRCPAHGSIQICADRQRAGSGHVIQQLAGSCQQRPPAVVMHRQVARLQFDVRRRFIQPQ